jgi:hypothetical protein
MKKPNVCFSTPFALAILMIGAFACQGAEVAASAEASPPPVRLVNYVLHVDWKSPKGGTNSLQLVTAEGSFRLEASQSNTVKVGDVEVPISINVSGELKPLDSEHGRLQFFLGRTVPYVTHAGGPPGSSSIQQRQEGLTSNFNVTFGKPVLIQKDGNCEVSVLVESVKP